MERATEGLVEQLLPVLDSFELAVGNLDDVDDKVRKGIELAYAELVAVLERAGLTRIGEVAKRIAAGEAGRGIAHAASGPCLQQNMVVVLEGE